MIKLNVMKQRIAIALAALMLIASLDASAQREHRRPYAPARPAFHGFGLTFGYVHSSYRTTDWATDEVQKSAGLDGFQIGLSKDLMLIPNALYFQFGLNYLYQNDPRNETMKSPAGDIAVRVVGDRTEHYLTVPVRIKYEYPLSYRVGFSLEAGPTVLAGLSSKMSYRSRISDSYTSSVVYGIYKGELESSDPSGVVDLGTWLQGTGILPEGRLRRFDILLGASVGADFFEILEVRMGYDWGLTNRYRGAVADDLKMHRGQFTLSCGLRF